MGIKFSKRVAAPEKKRSETNRTGGQRALKEQTKRKSGRIDPGTHGTTKKTPGSKQTG